MRKILCKSLFFGAHKLAHSGLYLSNSLIRRTVAIYHLKLVCLDFFEEVLHNEGCLEIWIQRIFNLLCLSNFDPIISFLLK